MPDLNYYDILEVAPSASDEVIRMAYKALMKKYHPDVFAGTQVEEERITKSINAAYEILADTDKRAKYDKDVASAHTKAEPEPEEPFRQPEESAKNTYTPSVTNNDANKKKNGCGSIIAKIIIAVFIMVVVIKYIPSFWDSVEQNAEYKSSGFISRTYLRLQYDFAEKRNVQLITFSKQSKLDKWLENNASRDDSIISLKSDNILGADRFIMTNENSGYTYIGETKKNRPHGYGILMETENSLASFVGEYSRFVYVREFKDGRYNGYGLLFNAPDYQDIYDFIFYTDIKAQDELITAYDNWLNHVIYDGEFKKGKFSGKGNKYIIEAATQAMAINTYLNKDVTHDDFRMLISSGRFSNDKLNGKVKIYDLDGYLEYDGGMKKEDKSGKGKLYYPQSTQLMYSGSFKNDRYHGKGTSYDENGSVIYSGKWKNGDYS